MKLTTLFTASLIAFASLNAAHAGNLSDIGLDDPEVGHFASSDIGTPERIECRILFGALPCHEGFEYFEPGGDDVTSDGGINVDDDVTATPVECKPAKSPKGGKKGGKNKKGGKSGKKGGKKNK